MARFFASRFNRTFEEGIDSWVYRYQFSCLLAHSLAVVPNRNLICNIGSGVDATNTRWMTTVLERKTEKMLFPLEHPPFMIPDRVADAQTFTRRYLPENSSLYWRAVRRLYYFVTGKEHVFSVPMRPGRLVKKQQ
jgi:hypothetical protein